MTIDIYIYLLNKQISLLEFKHQLENTVLAPFFLFLFPEGVNKKIQTTVISFISP